MPLDYKAMHSITGIDIKKLMSEIQDPDVVPVCLHGTTLDSFKTIVASGRLDRMKRTAIQMAIGPYGCGDVTSGVRSSSEVYIYIDVVSAMRDGLKFYRSSNGVICCEGPIPLRYFLRVIEIKTGKEVQTGNVLGI